MSKRVSLAQIGEGDEKIVAGPGYRDIPKCTLPLKTEEAQREYDRIARLLMDNGKFDMFHHLQASIYCSSFDTFHANHAAGKPIRTAVQLSMQKALGALKLHVIDKPLAASENAQLNKFAHCGFASRSEPVFQTDRGARS